MEEQLSFIKKEPITVLMSLREEYYEEIVKGEKKFEYRTRYLKAPSSAFIYISKTKKSIVAKIEFGMPIIGSAEEIASLAENEQPGCYNDMMSYFNAGIGYAIPILSISKIDEIKLDDLKEQFQNFVVPQSYYILNKKPELLDFLENWENNNAERK